MIIEEALKEIKTIVNIIVPEYRLPHIRGCAKFAVTLAKIHGLNEEIAEFLGLAHDIFRDLPGDKLIKISKGYNIKPTKEQLLHPILLHGKLAAEFVKFRFNIFDEDLLNALTYHTSGYKDFGVYGKLLFLADSLEETRNYPKVNYLRELAFKDINLAYFEVLKNKLIYAIERDLFILNESLEAWNNLIKERKGGKI